MLFLGWVYVIAAAMQAAYAVRIFATSTTEIACDSDALYGTEEYATRIRELKHQLLAIESGYTGLYIWLVLPIHIGSQLSELELVVVSPPQIVPIQNSVFEDLMEDVQHNLDDGREIKLIVVPSMNALAPGLRQRLSNIHPNNIPSSLLQSRPLHPPSPITQIATDQNRRVINDQSVPISINPQLEHRRLLNQANESQTLYAIAAELNIRIINITFSPIQISVALQSDVSRMMRNRFTSMARSRTRRFVRTL